MDEQRYSPALHRMAMITAVATFPLIFMGGLVTSHHAGMAVPDWPNTWGYNMFMFPPNKWVGGILYEHTHRLAASMVGFLTTILLVVAWYVKQFRWTAIALFLSVCLQGAIGGYRVIKSDIDFAIVHGIVAQLFFCFTATLCVMTSRFWITPAGYAGSDRGVLKMIRRVAAYTVAAILLQLVLGAVMRHSDAGLAIPDFPTSYGNWMPPLKLDVNFRSAAIHRYGTDLGLNRVSEFQIWIHFSHRLGAVLVTFMILWLSALILRRAEEIAILARPAAVLVILLAVQLTLGILTVLWRKPADIASAHVAVGSLVLVTAWVILVRTYRLRRFAASNSEIFAHPLVRASIGSGGTTA